MSGPRKLSEVHEWKPDMVRCADGQVVAGLVCQDRRCGRVWLPWKREPKDKCPAKTSAVRPE